MIPKHRDFGGSSDVRIPPIEKLREQAVKEFGAARAAKLDDVTLRAYAQTRQWVVERDKDRPR